MKPKHIVIALSLVAVTLLTTNTASADLISDSRHALQQLVAQNPAAAKAKSKAAAVLVFPDVVKAGFIFGAQGGQGILFVPPPASRKSCRGVAELHRRGRLYLR